MKNAAFQVSAVHHAAGHVLAVTRIALHHHRGWLEDRHGNLCHRQLLMVCFLGRDDWSVRREHEVDSRVGNQVGLELGDIHVERTIKTEGSCPERIQNTSKTQRRSNPQAETGPKTPTVTRTRSRDLEYDGTWYYRTSTASARSQWYRTSTPSATSHWAPGTTGPQRQVHHNTQPQTHNHTHNNTQPQHATTNTQSQTHSHKHTVTNTTTTNAQPQTQQPQTDKQTNKQASKQTNKQAQAQAQTQTQTRQQHTTTNTITNKQPQTQQPQTHKHKHKHDYNTQPQHTTTHTETTSTPQTPDHRAQPQHTTTAHNHNTQPQHSNTATNTQLLQSNHLCPCVCGMLCGRWSQGSTFGYQLETLATPRRELPNTK